ncbi:trypsin-like peptidase domain-containing protein [Sphaerisporangium rubeum]|uniref:Putative serine protease PepD n=1 Tax=Sphaerisporangium rubeum TaxID=321317 RepID=A0A7X0IJQ0_9ACTN|nr:trypsin-like peptidase domain-containing protein [Sphaerisporangium rubeum]MBB6476198.1 putative serine protease PepD [Sphaerisporangium rubeum]
MSDDTRAFEDEDVAGPSHRSGGGETQPAGDGDRTARPGFLPADQVVSERATPAGRSGTGSYSDDLFSTGSYATPPERLAGSDDRGSWGNPAGGPLPSYPSGGQDTYGRSGDPYGGQGHLSDPYGGQGRSSDPYGAYTTGAHQVPPSYPASRGDGLGGSSSYGGRTETYGSTDVFSSPSDTSSFGPPPPRAASGMGRGWAPPPPGSRPFGEPGGMGPGLPPGQSAGPAPRGPRTGTLAAFAVVIALIASTAGSLGTYLLTRGDGPGRDPSYSLGTPTGAIVNRAPDSVAGVAAKVLPSVVSLDVRGNSEAGTGSGFLIKGGYIVTNNHVVAAASSTGTIKVTFSSKKSTQGRIVGRDPSSDIAVVKPDTTFGAPEIVLGNSDKVVVGDPVIAIGSPLGLTGTVTTGIISSLNRPVTAGGEGGSESSFINAIQTDAAINPGNSGGPLVNGAGEVIGVNSAIATLGGSLGGGQSGSIGLGFSIPINHVRRIAEELITTGTAKKSRIGVQLDENYQGEGVRIATEAVAGQEPVIPGGPADKAGLKAGDIILEIDGNPMTQPSELIVTVRSKAPGTKINVKYQRNGETRTTSLTVDAVSVPTPQPS